ncbi:hypothetical protein A2U01_0079331, partial [Trifolium medium]|nr:hypothetical protein [Trifolium medium]
DEKKEIVERDDSEKNYDDECNWSIVSSTVSMRTAHCKVKGNSRSNPYF